MLSRRDEIELWRTFLVAEGQLLSRHPVLLFQQAANAQEGSPPTAAARAAESLSRRRWIRWLNKPAIGRLWRLSLGSRDAPSAVRAFAPDDLSVAGELHDGRICEWEAKTGRESRVFDAFYAVVHGIWYSGDGRRLLVSGRRSSEGPDELAVFDRISGACRHAFRARAYDAVSLDDSAIVLGEGGDGAVSVWRLVDSAFVVLFGIPVERRVWVKGEDGPSRRLLFSRAWNSGALAVGALTPDGGRAAVADGRSVQIWDVRTSKLLSRHSADVGHLNACRISPGGERIALAGAVPQAEGREAPGVEVVERSSGRTLIRLTGQRFDVFDVDFDPSGTRIATAAKDGTVVLWDAMTGTELRHWREHADAVTACRFSRSGLDLLSVSEDGTSKIWPVVGGTDPGRPQSGAISAASFPDGASVAAIVSRPPGLILAEYGAEGQGREIWHQTESRKCAAVSPGGTFIVTGSAGNEALVVSPKTGGIVRRLAGLSNPVRACAVSADGRWILGGGSWPDPMMVWDSGDGDPLRLLGGIPAGVNGCAVSPDNAMAAVCWEYGPPSVRVWDLTGRRPLPELEDQPADPSSCAFSPDGRTLVGCSPGEISLWEPATGRAVRRFVLGGRARGGQASFSPDGRYLIATTEQTLLVLEAESGVERARFESTTHLAGASLGPGATASVAALSRLLHLKLEAFEFEAAIATVAPRDPYDTGRTPDDLSVRCAWCGALLPASPNLVDEVRAVGRRWAPEIDRPAAFDLPAEAWREPGLVISCPACKGSLRLNPFVPITLGRDS